jgi:hypothetical protein
MYILPKTFLLFEAQNDINRTGSEETVVKILITGNILANQSQLGLEA